MADSIHEIRPIKQSDNSAVAGIIRSVMPEYGAQGPGFALSDPEVSCMYESYSTPGTAYFVLHNGNRVVGGGGIAPLIGGEGDTCELRKMYFLAEVRGKGYGQKLLAHCLSAARMLGYKKCYLETLKHMEQARRLYEKNGFQKLCSPLGKTGHFGCDAWYVKQL